MTQRVHIVGFKRSGTTLLQQLFHCFKDTYVSSSNGAHFSAGAHANVTESTVVTKYSKDAYFVDELLKKGAKIIYTIRDPRDTLTSKFNKTGVRASDPAKLAHRINVFNESDIPSITSVLVIRYEKLVQQPDVVQTALSSWLDLEIDIPFSEGHIRMQDDTLQQALNGIRPVDTNSIGRWKEPEYREEVEEIVSRYPEMQKFIQRWYPDV